MIEPWRTLKQVLAEARALLWPEDAAEARELPPFAPAYDRVFRSLAREDLYGEPSALLDEDLTADLFAAPEQRNHHFLGFYSEEGAKLAFERYGFFDLLREKGFDPQLFANLDDANEHKLQIYDGIKQPDRLLIELAVGFRDIALPDGAECRMLFLNWLLMQDPRQSFSPSRPPLPDQKYPGLGLFPHFGYLMRLMALRLECDGLLNHPSHFHNAVLYGKFFHFIDPAYEGFFRALQRDLAGMSLSEATTAVQEGQVRDRDGTPVGWEPQLQAAPITNRARRWFASKGYQEQVRAAKEGHHFR